MNVKLILVVLSVLFFFGCATKLWYQPEKHSDIQQSVDIVKRSLRYQSPSYAVNSVDVTPDYIKVVGVRDEVNYINFDNIAKIELHEKRKWKIVSILAPQDFLMYRLYVTDEKMAREFINAVYTLEHSQKKI